MNFSVPDLDMLFTPSDSDLLLTLIWILPLFIFVMYGQRIQLSVTSREIKKNIEKLYILRKESRKQLAEYANSVHKGSSENASLLADYFTVFPIDMDPTGLVPKVRHLMRSKEDAIRTRITNILPDADEVQISKMQTLVELAISLQMIHKMVNHLFLTAKKQHNYPLILPLQMVLPTVMEEAQAMYDALEAFNLGQPIGDGIGPFVTAKMMYGLERINASKETDMCRTKIDGRNVCIIKARGPMSNVGRIADAIDFAISKYGKPSAIITVDAAKKLEGEDTGEIARGFGIAMGGIGTERFQIEETATNLGIPMHAVVVKQSIKESLTLMTKEISDTMNDTLMQTRHALQETVPNGGDAIIIGVGNTSGVP
ncbi:MAG: hypothetical protein K8823_1198 [Cenarchaeum symbiont of Oopsacas minuta]|nr:hypothetical protein [Cenarchaeum symbiont of Oopsacas minuta]